jgi:hypothetical protein
MILCAAVSFAQKAMPGFEIPTAQSNGMGGPHVAYTDNVFALLVNPAAIMRVEQKSFLTLSPALYSPETVLDLIDPISTMIQDRSTSALGDAMDALSKKKGKIPLGVDIREFPLSIAWVADGFGFGLWNRISIQPSIVGTNVKLDVYGDVVMPISFAFKILDMGGHSLDMGITAKPFARVYGSKNIAVTDLMDDSYDISDDINVPLVVGGGVDAGLMYRWDIGLSAGVTFDDIYTRGYVITDLLGKDDNTYYVPFTINAGVAYDLRLGNFLSFALMADYRDVANLFEQDDYLKRNALLGIGAGVQLGLWNIIKLRAGMSELLPSVGVGLDLGPLEIDAAYYGKEFGLEPGQLSAAVMDVTVAIRPGAKKRNWPWARRSLVGLFTGGD